MTTPLGAVAFAVVQHPDPVMMPGQRKSWGQTRQPGVTGIYSHIFVFKDSGMMPACEACGNPDPNELKECPHCGSTKCDACDMGDDVECPACPDPE